MEQQLKKNRRLKKGEDEIPYGREAIKEAILDAAEEILAKHNPDEVSVRQIAKAAKINHSLVHRHFGTKENVIVAVHERIIERMALSISGAEQLEGNMALIFKTSKDNHSRRILLTRAMLNGINPHLIQNHFPVMHRLLNLVKKQKADLENPSKYDAEVLTAFFTAAVMGWFLYEPFLLASTGLEEKNQEEIHNQIVELLEEAIHKFC
jgi:TetR/AcrR family transcriptional regulator, repressor for neighboring sulfatase